MSDSPCNNRVPPDGYTLIEFGILTTPTQSVPTFTDVAATKYQGSNYLGTTNEFVMSFSTVYASVRPYMILEDGTSSIVEVYGATLDVPYGIFISEYIEGSFGTNKAIELYNPTALPVTLTNYAMAYYPNGAIVANPLIPLDTYTIPAGGVLVIYNNSSVESITEIGDVISSASFNGDDAVALLLNGVVVDQFGVIGEDPGSSWSVKDGSTANQTIIRDASVTGPSPVWNTSEWNVYPQDTFGLLDRHYAINGTDLGARPLFDGTGPAAIDEGSTYNPLTGVTASDYEDGVITGDITYTVYDSTPTLVAAPGDFSALAVGTYTIVYSITDTDSNVSTRTIELTISAVVAGVLYSTGFEVAEGFTTGTNYSNTTEKIDGPSGQQWAFYYGTVSTTGEITGLTSAQNRWYTSAPGNIGYSRTDFTVTDPLNVVFNAKTPDDLSVEVSYSYDKTTWYGSEIFALTSSGVEYTYDMSGFTLTGPVYIMFKIVLPATTPTSTSDLIIDDVVINESP